MEHHVIPVPHETRFTRLRFPEGGIPRDLDTWIEPSDEPGAPGVLHVRGHLPAGLASLDFTAEVSTDGRHWAACAAVGRQDGVR